MVRISKQNKKRSQSPRKHRPPEEKTGAKKDRLAKGFREHPNSIEGDLSKEVFISKIR